MGEKMQKTVQLSARQKEALLKCCKRCGSWKPIPGFRKVLDIYGRRVIRCQQCSDDMEEQKAFYDRNPEVGEYFI